MKRASIALGCVLLLGNSGSNAQQHQTCTGAQLGTWALKSYTVKDLESGQEKNDFGLHPSGYLSYGPDCRMYVILLKENRKAPAELTPTDQEKIELYSGLIAYAGSYTVDGDKFIHHIDASWNQAWTGTTVVRQFKIEGNSLQVRTMPAKNPLTGRQSTAVLVYTKVE